MATTFALERCRNVPKQAPAIVRHTTVLMPRMAWTSIEVLLVGNGIRSVIALVLAGFAPSTRIGEDLLATGGRGMALRHVALTLPAGDDGLAGLRA